MNAFCWAATLVCLAGSLINVKRINWCFLFWIVGELMWIAYDLGQHLLSRTLLDAVGLAFAVWGAWENLIVKKNTGWRSPAGENHENHK